MKSAAIRTWKLAGCVATAAAALAVMFILNRDGKKTSSGVSPQPVAHVRPQERPKDGDVRIKRNERGNAQDSGINAAASQVLIDHFKAGEQEAILDELASLSESHSLASVGGVLKEWCASGPLQLAQWSLAYSLESDPELNLTLCAEALSNPSDVIREIATAQLEASAGTSFENPRDARNWVLARQKR